MPILASIPKIFISYSQDGEPHIRTVLALANRLRFDGLDCCIDKYFDGPAEGWPRWMNNQLSIADYILVVCTEDYYHRFRGSEKSNVGSGVDWEGSLITQYLYSHKSNQNRVRAVLASSSDKKWIPEALAPYSHYDISSEPGYEKLYGWLTNQGVNGPPDLGTIRKLPEFKGPTLGVDLPFGGNAEKALGPLKSNVQFEALEEPRFDAVALIAAADYSLIRLTFESLGSSFYRVSIQSRVRPGDPFRTASVELPIVDDPTLVFAQLVDSFEDFSSVIDASASIRPIRLQLRFSTSAKTLDNFRWEEGRIRGQAICGGPSYIFSRHLVLPDADIPDLRIKPEAHVRFSVLYVSGRPAAAPPGNAEYLWNVGGRPSLELDKTFHINMVHWGQRAEGLVNADKFDHELSQADVVYMPLSVAFSQQKGAPSYVVMPDPNASLTAQLGFYDTYQFISRLRKLRERPIVMIFAPCGWTSGTDSKAFSFISDVAREVSASGICSVVVLSEPVNVTDWNHFVSKFLLELRDHGFIDVAMERARRKALSLTSCVRLYLRNKSARLWYQAGFVSVMGNGGFDWSKLAKSFKGTAGQQCALMLGPDVDKELKLSRKQIAREIASRNGFSLSLRDEENLARVSEYVKVRGRLTSLENGVANGIPAHVTEFLQNVSDYLITEVVDQGDRVDASRMGILQLTQSVGMKRLREMDCPYRLLGRVKSSCFVTTNFHDIVEQGLAAARKVPISVSYIPRESPIGKESQSRARIEKALAEVSISRPLVYHCFGSFAKPQHLVLAESDHLNFFTDFLNASAPDVAALVRGHLVESTLIFLGFNPESSDFRVLFSALKKMPGAALAKRNVHVAVQLDPEDDLTIDPDGARNFYEGLLKPLGENVFVYWGKPDQFLREMNAEIPEAFL